MNRLVRIVSVLALIVCAVAPVYSGGAAEAPAGGDGGSSTPAPVRLVIGTGGTSGLYYPIGGQLKTVFEESALIESVTVESTGASVMNVNNINDGLNQIAIVQSDVAYDAVNGVGRYDGNQIDIVGIAGLYPNVVQVVVTAASGITSIEDMRGRRIGVGAVGSGVEQSAQKVLEAAGLTYSDLAQVTNTGYADSVQSMRNGTLDGAFFTSGVPNSNILDLFANMDVQFVEIDGALADRMIEANPYYERVTIPAGDPSAYNLDAAVDTVAIRNILIASPMVSDAVAEEMASRFYAFLGSGTVTIDALRTVNRDTMDEGLVVPMHPGAMQFYGSR